MTSTITTAIGSTELSYWQISKKVLYSGNRMLATQTYGEMSQKDLQNPSVRLIFALAGIRCEDLDLATANGFPKSHFFSWLATHRLGIALTRHFTSFIQQLILKKTIRSAFLIKITFATIQLLTAKMSAPHIFFNIYRSMWTEHQLCLVYSLAALARSYNKKDPDSCRFLWFTGFACGLNGFSDFGSYIAKEGLERIESHKDKKFYPYWKHEALCLTATVTFYAGDTDSAIQLHEEATETFISSCPDFRFSEAYNQAIKMRVAHQIDDQDMLTSTITSLKNILGDRYDLRFALRASSYEAVYHYMNHSRSAAMKSLILADSLADKTPSGLEYYYYLINKSRIFYLENQIDLAIEYIQKAITGIESTSSFGFHVMEGYFQLFRYIISSQYLPTLSPKSRTNRQQTLMHCQARLIQLVKHSEVFAQKLDIYNNFMEATLVASVDDIRHLLTEFEKDIGIHGYDLIQFLNSRFTEAGEGSLVKESINSESISIHRLRIVRQFSSYLESMQSPSLKADQIYTTFYDFLSKLIPCEKVATTSNRLGKAYTDGINILGQKNESIISFEFNFEPEQQIVVVSSPITDLLFQRDLLESLAVLKEVADAAIRQIIMQAEREKLLKAEAIANTTQMLAHDVRKPFAMLQGTLDLIVREEDHSQIKNIAQRAIPEIQSTINSVNGMIDDVMEVGSKSDISKEPTSIRQLIAKSLKENLRYSKANITFSYDLQLQNKLSVAPQKMVRVFSNIVGNAIEAMDRQGHIKICSRAAEKGFATICISNSGPPISQDIAENLFDIFFTSNKKTGTGLGLAIAKKIVEDHQGVIGCNSPKDSNVEFWFTIPISDMPEDSTEPLPSSVMDLNNLASRYTGQSQSQKSLANPEKGSLKSNYLENKKIVLIDDNKTFQDTWKGLIDNGSFISFDTPEEFISGFLIEPDRLVEADAIVIDNNFSPLSQKSGFDLARVINKLNITTPLVLSTSELFSECEIQGIFQYQIAKNPKQGIRELDHFLTTLAKPQKSSNTGDKIDLTKNKLRHDLLNKLIELEILGTNIIEGQATNKVEEKIRRIISTLHPHIEQKYLKSLGQSITSPESFNEQIINLKINVSQEM